MASPPILIVGGGIAGLALGIALSQRGLSARILERRDEPAEAGAGIQLGPNAMHALARLGAAAHLEPLAGAPEAIEVADGASGRRLARLPLGASIAQRHGAPYRVAHRADLHAALLARARAIPGLEIVPGFAVSTVAERDGSVEAVSETGARETGTWLAGADGLWSSVRRTLFPACPLGYSGKMAARTVIASQPPGSRFARAATAVWLGRDAHVVHYPVRAGREIAVVAIVDEPRPREGWGGAIDGADVLLRLSAFASELRAFLALGQDWRVWSLYDPEPLPAWSKGRVGLVGDAAHPILPFLAQGGAMALEDALVLADVAALHHGDPPAAWRAFEAQRRTRVARVQKASRANGTIFHLSGVTGRARNLTLAMVPGALMMARYDWLYGWK